MSTRHLLRWFIFAFASLIVSATAHAQAQFAGTYTGVLFVRTTSTFPGVPAIETSMGFFSVTVTASGALTGTNFTGTVNASGNVTFATNALGLTTGTISNNQLNTPYGTPVGNGVLTHKLVGSGFTGGGALQPPVVVSNPLIPTVAAGASVTYTATTNEAGATWQWKFNGNNIAGATSSTYTIASVQSSHAGIYSVVLTARGQSIEQAGAPITVNATAPALVTISAQPVSQNASPGGSVNLSVTLGHPSGTTASYQWTVNGGTVSGATATSLNVNNVQPANTGVYALRVNANGSVSYSEPAIIGLLTALKTVGTAIEHTPNIPHPNGNTFDQVLLTGEAATFTADNGQVTRCSFLDANDDIVQIEFSGAGTVSVSLAGATGPATPTKYNQPTVQYMRGTPKITIVGANSTTNLSIFTVGRQIAFVNPALFPTGMTYDGVADIGLLAISSPTGQFGALRLANTGFIGTAGMTGVYAPGVNFAGPVYVHDITAADDADPVLVTGTIGGNGEILITGGSLAQTNGRSLAIGGATALRMSAGSTSHGVADLPAQANAATITRDGQTVTSSVIVGP